MNKNTHSNVLLRVLVALMAVTLLFGMFAGPQAEASSYKASYIEQLNDVKVDISQYLDGNVAYQLPEGVSDDELISIIIDLPIVDLLDAYEATDKTMSFGDFALESDVAKETTEKIAAKKDLILNKLDQLAINYTVGDDYSVLMAGFEITIRAGDFNAVCKTMDYDVNVIVGEVYNVAETQLVENFVNVYDTGIIDSSMVKYDGTGTVVAVLDTGIDYAHSAFSVENFTTKVWFATLTEDEIERYLDTDEPYDKAGAYAIQGKASVFISGFEGCYFNVVGLPVRKLYEMANDHFDITLF